MSCLGPSPSGAGGFDSQQLSRVSNCIWTRFGHVCIFYLMVQVPGLRDFFLAGKRKLRCDSAPARIFLCCLTFCATKSHMRASWQCSEASLVLDSSWWLCRRKLVKFNRIWKTTAHRSRKKVLVAKKYFYFPQVRKSIFSVKRARIRWCALGPPLRCTVHDVQGGGTKPGRRTCCRKQPIAVKMKRCCAKQIYWCRRSVIFWCRLHMDPKVNHQHVG